MERDPETLGFNDFDLLVIGGGIHGAAVTWEAASRGLSVALVERTDFAAGTSSNSLKIIHGGLRYLQHLDLKRLRESMRERRNLMRIAPHLVHPLPTVVPVYGHGVRGRQGMRAALLVNDLLTLDRNRHQAPPKHIPRGRMISAEACAKLIPGLDERGLTGGALYHDAQVYDSERLVLAFVRSAVREGAVAANYVEVKRLLMDGGRVMGARVEDRLEGNAFDVRARMTVNTAGPWAGEILRNADGGGSTWPGPFARAINVVTRPLFGTRAVGLPGGETHDDPDAAVQKGARYFFVAPWRGCSLVGTGYTPHSGQADDLEISPEEVSRFLGAFNSTLPGMDLSLEDVHLVHKGLLPMAAGNRRDRGIRLEKHYQIRDHREDGLEGLVSVSGVKYTTARHVAEKVVDRVHRTWGRRNVPSRTARLPLDGGGIENVERLLGEAVDVGKEIGIGAGAMHRLVLSYGSRYRDVLRHLDPEVPPAPALLRAQVLHAVGSEMARKLTDAVFRRTGIGSTGHPGRGALLLCARTMGTALGWDEARVLEEVRETDAAYPPWAARRADPEEGARPDAMRSERG